MIERPPPRLLSIPAGVPFLPALASALLAGRLVPGFKPDSDPLALADVTIYVPTRRSARALRGVLLEKLGGRSAILPTIRPLGEFDDDLAMFESGEVDTLALAPPIAALDRLLLLAPLVQAWKRRLPAHVAQLYGEEVVVPASLADALWLARDLADLIDEIETEGADWRRLIDLVPGDLATWWQVTLEFLQIVTEAWPQALAERERSNPAAHRNATILAEAARLERNPPAGPVVAAGSTGSIPATATLLAVIANLPSGAVVLPGLDKEMDTESWGAIGATAPASFGHPQTALRKLIGAIGAERSEIGELARPDPAIEARIKVVVEALRPAETTHAWSALREVPEAALAAGAFDGVSLVEAANEREEAIAIAVALRLAVADAGRTAALVTGDRELARRVSAELKRFGIKADDSGGTPLGGTPPATLLRLMLESVFRPGDPVPILALLKHPLLHLGLEREFVRRAAETVELVALRGDTGRPDIARLGHLFQAGTKRIEADRKPFWWIRHEGARLAEAQSMLDALHSALQPLIDSRGRAELSLAELARGSVEALEGLGREADGSLHELYRGDAGAALADFLRGLVGNDASVTLGAVEWPETLAALMAGETVKPSASGDDRISIWGTLEARLQAVDTLVLGGLNEGSWPRRPEAGRFMSRVMKSGMSLEPPERRIGQAAHDFQMALGTERVVLARSLRAGGAPAVESRWLQRLRTFGGEKPTTRMRQRGNEILDWARQLDAAPDVPFVTRPCPRPPLALRPTRLSVTEIETLRRDPYAIYARHVLKLEQLKPVLRDPGAAERGSLFHDIVHGFLEAGIDADAPDAESRLVELGRACFDRAALPSDIDAVWWPRFVRMAGKLVRWEAERGRDIAFRYAEIPASEKNVGATGVTLRGRADRIDIGHGGGAVILDFKTGLTPSKVQAHRLIAPQLPLEGALLMLGAFPGLEHGPTPFDLAYVRLRPDGEVREESILSIRDSTRTAEDLSQDAWRRLELLLAHYGLEETGYLSRALPFREGDVGGQYDHLARVLEWSAGADDGDSGDGG